MKKLFSFLILVIAFLMTACSQEYTTVGNDEFSKIISKKNTQLVDVRTPQEYEAGHIPGALNIDVKSADFDTQAACAQPYRRQQTHRHGLHSLQPRKGHQRLERRDGEGQTTPLNFRFSPLANHKKRVFLQPQIDRFASGIFYEFNTVKQ